MDATTSLRTVLILLCALVVPMGLAAEDAHTTKHHHYKLIDTGTLGGSFSSLGFEGERDINNRGEVVSLAETTTPDPTCFNAPLDPTNCLVAHTVLWRKGVLSDLGALAPGYNSGPLSITDSGMVVGFSLNSLLDPLTGSPEFQAVLFKDGHVIDLGGLGGNESTAFGINNRGEVVGCATNPVPDAFGFCMGGLQQSRAFLWKDGKMEDLGTLGGADAVAQFVNNGGEVAGWSLIDSPTPIQHLFLWNDGNMRDLGNLGGTAVPLINGMNDSGQIVGGMTVAGDQSVHPFLWDGAMLRDLGTLGGDSGSANSINEAGEVVGLAQTQNDQAFGAFIWRKGRMNDLGGVGADPNSVALSINSRGQVVGGTTDNDGVNLHAFIWEKGSIADLNSLIPTSSAVRLTAAPGINDRGEIAAQGVLSNGDLHAFLLIPCDENHPDIEGCDYSLMDAAATAAQAATAARDSELSAARQARGPLSSTRALPAASESSSVRQPLALRLGFGRFTKGVFQFTSEAAVTSGPSATLSPASLTFPTQAVGTLSGGDTVTLKNTGTTSVSITAIAIVGTNAGDFAQTHTCRSSLAAGASCSISVTFKPTASGTRSAALSITDNAAGSPQKVGLTGVGTTAKLSLTRLSFGAVVLGTSSPANTVTLTNVGTTTLTISGIAITGTNGGDFAQTHTCGNSLAAGANCTVSVAFKPTQIGNRSGTLSVTDNAPGSPQTVSLSGTGTEVALSPTSLRFACFIHNFPVPHCVCFTSQTATLTNVGRTTLNISGIAISRGFSQTNSCGASVAAGGSCSINVRWSPGASPLEPGSVSISDNGGASPQMLGLLAHKLCTPQ